MTVDLVSESSRFKALGLKTNGIGVRTMGVFSINDSMNRMGMKLDGDLVEQWGL